MRDPLDQAVEALKAKDPADLEIVRFGRTFQDREGRELMRQRLLTVLERASADSQPPGVIAQIHNDIGVIEISLGNTDQAITHLIDSILISVEGIRNDLFFTAILTWSVLAFLVDRMESSEIFRLSLMVGFAVMRLWKIREQITSDPDKHEELGEAIAWLNTIKILGTPKEMFHDLDPYAPVLKNAKKLDTLTENRLHIEHWVEERLEIVFHN